MAWVPALGALRLGVLAALWGAGAVLLGGKRPLPRQMWYMLALVGVMAWNVPWALNRAFAFWGFEDFAIMTVGCIIPLAVLPMDLAGVRLLLTTYVFLHVPMAIYAVLHQGRGLGAWMEDENDLALAFNAAMGVAIYLIGTHRRPLVRLLLVGSIGLLLAAVVSSLSRGGFVGLAALGVFMLVTGPHRGRIALAVGAAALALWFAAPEQYWTEIRSIETADQEGDTGDARLYSWGLAWRMFLDHPVTGVGTRNYGIQAPLYEDVMRKARGEHMWGRAAHSLFFTLLSEQGVVGTLLFSGLIASCVRAAARLRRRAAREIAGMQPALLATACLAGIFAVLVAGAFISTLYYPMLWILIALLASVEGLSAKNDQPPPAPTATPRAS